MKSSQLKYRSHQKTIFTPLPIVNVKEIEPIVMMDVEDFGDNNDFVTGIFRGIVEFRSKSVDAYEDFMVS